MRHNSINAKDFHVPFQNAPKSYTTIGWLKKHLRHMHRVNIELPTSSSRSSSHDEMFRYASEFMKVALLYRDTVDCYKMGDGDRLSRNLKFLMLHFGHGKGTKYQLWVWHMLAYDIALLSEAERFMYKWNIAVNVTGGLRKCIPNDYLVEIYVQKVKEAMRAMGANVTFNAVRRAAKCINWLERMSSKLAGPQCGKHAQEKTEADMEEVAISLVKLRNLECIPGRSHQTF